MVGLAAGVLPFVLAAADDETSADTLKVGDDARPEVSSSPEEVVIAAGAEDEPIIWGVVNEQEMAFLSTILWELPTTAEV